MFTAKSDVYALGIIMWELLARDYPFASSNFKMAYQLENAIRQGVRPEIPASAQNEESQEFILLMQRCWSQLVSNRPTMADVDKELSTLLTRVPGGDEGKAGWRVGHRKGSTNQKAVVEETGKIPNLRGELKKQMELRPKKGIDGVGGWR